MRIPSVVTGTCEFAWDACPGGGAGGADSSLATAINAACCHCCSRSCLPLLLRLLLRFLSFLLGLAGTRPSIHQSMRTSTVRGMSATNVAMVAQCQTENLMGIFESRGLFFEEQRLIQSALNMGYKDKDNQQQLKGK